MQPEIRPADPGRRRMAVLLVVITAIAGVFLAGAVQNWLAEYMANASQDPEQYRYVISRTLAYAAGVNCALILFFGAYLWRGGSNVRKADVFPLPAAKLIRDTKVLRGKAAQTRGRVMQVLGALLAACAVALAVAGWRLLSLMD